jgi:potassium-transporting ATPase potassium-binding subunit
MVLIPPAGSSKGDFLMWLLPLLIVGLAVGLAVPLGLFMARVLDRPGPANWLERLLDTGPQSGKHYLFAMLLCNVAAFAIGYILLALQPNLPLNPDGKKMLAASTIFNTASSFLTNTNLQHYSGEKHLSYFSQLFVIGWKQLLTPAIGLAALLAMIRGLRGDKHLGNFYIDLWRGFAYVMLPLSVILAVLLMAEGVPMTLNGNQTAHTLEGKEQTIARGPVASVVAIKQLGTNGGGFFGANSAHPYENPTAWSNVLECASIILIPLGCIVLFGRMIGNLRHAIVLGVAMMLFMLTFTAWGIANDTMQPNPALTERPANKDLGEKTDTPALPVEKTVGNLEGKEFLPVEKTVGNLEGKELRFGPSAGPTWAALTTCTSNGSVNCMHDSLNPLAGLAPMSGMWLNCIVGGVGVGLINLLVYLIVAVFLSGLMVGRTPEYLGKKVEAREMKLAMLALLIHPIAILAPTGFVALLEWGTGSITNPGPHGLSQILYEFSSASANNGSEFGGLQQTWGFADDAGHPAYAFHWDVATGLIMLICRFVPIIAPIALASSLSHKKPTPFTTGTLRTDTVTFGVVLVGIIVLVGALLFMPVAVLGPVADHLGPMPFGR